MPSRLLLPIETVSVHLQLLATLFINKSLQLGTSELLPKNNKQNSICILKFFPPLLSSLSQFAPFFETSLSYVFLSSPPLFPPSSPSLPFCQLQQGRTTDTPLGVNLSGKECACLHWEHIFFFGSSGQAFSKCERGARGDPRRKQTAGPRVVPPPADCRDSGD